MNGCCKFHSGLGGEGGGPDGVEGCLWKRESSGRTKLEPAHNLHLASPSVFSVLTIHLSLTLFVFWFLELHLHHTEVPRLGVKSALQLAAYTTATLDP